MPKFVNKNSHPIRVRNGDGANLRRVRCGEVVEADGVLADNLEATSGVESASSADEKSWQAVLDAQHGPHGDQSHSTESLQEVVDSVQAVRSLASDNLQTVVGDNAAPHGPDTGTITTKDAVREHGSDADRAAFPEPGVDAALRHEGGQQNVADSAQRVKDAQVARGAARKSRSKSARRQSAADDSPSGE